MVSSKQTYTPVKALSKGFPAFIAFALLLNFTACNSDDDGGDQIADFDRAAMFTNITNTLILPGYSNLDEKVGTLVTAADAFEDDASQSNLEALRTAYKDAYLAFQGVKVYEIGPASSVSFRTALNTYPTDADKIEDNITNDNLNLDALTNQAAKGFPALDYLLYGLGDDAVTLNEYTNDPNANTRKEYLLAVVEEIEDKTTTVLDGWNPSGGDYGATLAASTGTDVGSSLGLLINELNFDYELIKNAKVGIPLGVKTLGVAQPEKVEALYSGISVELALANLQSIRELFLGGPASSANALGLDDHLDHVNATHDGASLSQEILNQLTMGEQGLAAINTPLADAVINDASTVQTAYNDLQLAVVLLKTDMTSALGVLITYEDGDGD